MKKFSVLLAAATSAFALPQAFTPEAAASRPANGTRTGEAGVPVTTVTAAIPTAPNLPPQAPVAPAPANSSAVSSGVAPSTIAISSTLAASSTGVTLIATSSVVPASTIAASSPAVTSSVVSSVAAPSSSAAACSAAAPVPSSGSESTLPSSLGQKPIVVQHIVGNTQPFTLADWKEDIGNASSVGFDGFALQVGVDDWQSQQVDLAYQAAAQGNTTKPFGLFIQLDMSSLPCTSASDLTPLTSLISKYATHPNTTTINGKPLVTTFSGSKCTFGQQDAFNGWAAFKRGLNNTVHFMPAFQEDPSSGFGGLGCVMDGAFNWNGAYPTSLTTPPKDVDALLAALNTDAEYASATLGKTFMTTISTWMAAHYSDNNLIYSGDQWLVDTRIRQLLAAPTQPDIVQLHSWNDFASSNYISRVKGTLPKDTTTVAGFGHNDASGGWQLLFRLYVPLYKTGVEPTVVRESMIMWARTHPASAQIPTDTVGRPDNADATADALWGLVFLREPATILLQTSDNGIVSAFDLPAGINAYTAPLTPGGYINNTLIRNGSQLYTYRNQDYTFEANPTTYNFNAFVMSN